jgi:hypothetical protein
LLQPVWIPELGYILEDVNGDMLKPKGNLANTMIGGPGSHTFENDCVAWPRENMRGGLFNSACRDR